MFSDKFSKKTNEIIISYLKNKQIKINNMKLFITGGSGSFGKAFISHIITNYKPKKIIVFSRDEQKHFLLQKHWHKYSKKIKYLIGDVRDFERVNFAMKEVDIVIHAAAMKHVPLNIIL